MGEIKLLDCTLRDGGYINDWNFGHNNLVSIFERSVDANVDIIEIGFLDDRRPFDINRSIMPDTDCVAKIFGDLDRKQAMVVGMIDYGTCDLKNIKPCDESYLDGIRVIFKKHLREPAMAYCAELKKLGYKVFAQLVSVTSYEDDEMMDLIRIANEVKPYAVSMVDTYGLMHQDNLKHYFELLDEHLDIEIGLGYHAHNNFQMGYANCIEMLSHKTDRMLLVDGSIYGMGKSAGNAPIELIAMHLNHVYEKDYHISQFLEAIDVNISNFYHGSTWGYNLFYYLAASNDCHPTYVSDLINKRTLSVKSINEVLSRLQGEKKLLYDKEYIERLYKEYQDIDIDDSLDVKRLSDALSGKDILILGPGKNLRAQKDRINKCIVEKNPIVISINFIENDIDSDYIFLSNSKRYLQLSSQLSRTARNNKVIATSNVTKTNGQFDFTLKYSSLIDNEADVIDNSLIMLLKVLSKIKVNKIYMAGLDGHSVGSSKDYIDEHMEYTLSQEQVESINEYARSFLKSSGLVFEFVTDSIYQ